MTHYKIRQGRNHSSLLPNYEYGSRRDNPTPVINNSGHFSRVMSIEKAFVVEMFTPDIVAAPGKPRYPLPTIRWALLRNN